MTKHPVQTSPSSAVPSASEFTSGPLRNRLRVELDASVSEVWELVGDLARFPEYSVGLERVEAKTDENGRCRRVNAPRTADRGHASFDARLASSDSGHLFPSEHPK